MNVPNILITITCHENRAKTTSDIVFISINFILFCHIKNVRWRMLLRFYSAPSPASWSVNVYYIFMANEYQFPCYNDTR